MFWGFKAEKIKPQLKMAVHRLQIASNKKVSQIKNQKRDIAKLLAELPNPKEEKARIRAEALIREDSTVEAYEILQLNCELLAERIKLVASEKECPSDLKSVVTTLIWASARVDIAELVEVRKQLRSKYGKKFEEECLSNTNESVNQRVYAKLSIQPPPALLVQTYLERIAEEFEVNWKPKMPLLPEEMPLPARAPSGTSVPVARASGYGDSYVVPQPANIVLPGVSGVLPVTLPPNVPDPIIPSQPPSNAHERVIPAPPPSLQPGTVLPGVQSIPGIAPSNKPNLPTAHIGMSIPPPFVEEESSTSSEEVEIEYIPDSTTFDIPSAPSTAPAMNFNNNNSSDDNDDKNDSNGNDDDTNGGNFSDSFRDLEARFADLKK